jgi:hypothetical protein
MVWVGEEGVEGVGQQCSVDASQHLFPSRGAASIKPDGVTNQLHDASTSLSIITTQQHNTIASTTASTSQVR